MWLHIEVVTGQLSQLNSIETVWVVFVILEKETKNKKEILDAFWVVKKKRS